MTPDELSHIEHDALEGYALPCEDTLRLVGHIKLTPRQREVARLISFPDTVIAAKLGISEETVAYHIKEIKRRLNLDGSQSLRAQIAEWVAKAA